MYRRNQCLVHASPNVVTCISVLSHELCIILGHMQDRHTAGRLAELDHLSSARGPLHQRDRYTRYVQNSARALRRQVRLLMDGLKER